MTRIRMDWNRMELTAEGHAGGGPRGKDIICAGISALMMALVNQLAEEDEKAEWEEDAEEGKIRIKTGLPMRSADRILDYYRVIMTGLKAWGQAFPANIEIEEVYNNGAD